MAYDDERTKLSRIPCQYIRISFRECANTFGDAPCTASGDRCWNTYPTCKDKTNYNVTTRQYHFTSNDAPLPFRTGERPYIKSVNHLPQEIKNEVTVNQRINIDLYDEPDPDVTLAGAAWLLTEAGEGIITEGGTAIAAEGITLTASVVSYFKKLFARHPDWYNRTIETFEGFTVATNLSIDNFKRKFIGKIKSVEFNGNIVRIEAVDLLTNLNDIQYPAPTKGVSLKKSYSGLGTIKFNNASNLSTGYISIGEEIVHLATLSTVTGKGDIDSYGDFFTPATSHGKKAAVQQCALVTPQNPFDIISTLLTGWGEIDSTSVDTTALNNLKTWPGRECHFTQVLAEPKNVSDLLKDLLIMTECHVYIDENQKIVVGRNFLKNSTNPWYELTDSAHIIANSEKVKFDSENIITQVTLDWDAHVGMARDAQHKKWYRKHFPNLTTNLYEQMSVHTDTEMESTRYHDQRFDETIQTDWLHTILSYPGSDMGYASASTGFDATDLWHPETVKSYADNWAQRYVTWRSKPKTIYEFDVEMKDGTVAVGDQMLMSGDIFLDSSGDNLNKVPCFVAKKESNNDYTQTLIMEDYGARIGLIAPDSQVDYTSALSSQFEYGFISDTNNHMSNGNRGYVIY